MAKQSVSFSSGLTQKAMILGVAPVIVALYSIWNGVYYINKFPGAGNLPFLLLFSILPLVFGIGIVAFTAFVISKNLGRKLVINPDGLVYTHGKESVAFSWALAAFSLPRTGKLYRTLAITDGKKVVRVEELFFNDFDHIAQTVADAKGGKR
ncbi:MAG: hypothetical protein EB084_00185 [Proteobacteria bacterium]|nr:hypothetical protein [Pseudomonadota bacterium]